MKKIIAGIVAVLMLTVSFAGCNNDPLSKQNVAAETTATTEADNASEKEEPKDKIYSETVDGMAELFIDKGYLTKEQVEKDMTEMDATLIGAEEGKRYKTALNNAEILIELYSYNPKDLNDTAKKIISSVKEKGEFELIKDHPAPAYLSDNEEFLMVYTDKSNPAEDTDNYKRMQEVVETFKAFPTVK